MELHYVFACKAFRSAEVDMHGIVQFLTPRVSQPGTVKDARLEIV
jgi:hypothetical protein